MSDELPTIKPEEVADFLDKAFAARLEEFERINTYGGACALIPAFALAIRAYYSNWDTREISQAAFNWARHRMPRAPFAKPS